MSYCNDWDDVDKIIHHTFYNELRLAPEEHGVIVCEPPLNPKASRERMVQLMFETYQVPMLCMVSQAVLTVMAGGRRTGIAVLVGLSSTFAVPVFDGYALDHATVRTALGGSHVTAALVKLIEARHGLALTTSSDLSIANDIKAQRCAICPSLADALAPCTTVTYELPDGNVLQLAGERFLAGEVLFSPWECGVSSADVGIHEAVIEAVSRCDRDLREAMIANVVIAGATAKLPGLPARLLKELRSLAPDIIAPNASPPRLFIPENPAFAVFEGAFLLNSLAGDTLEGRVITKEAYDARGPSVVHRRCW